jgi:hypothetical protein
MSMQFFKRLFGIDDFGAGCFGVVLIGVITSSVLVYHLF